MYTYNINRWFCQLAFIITRILLGNGRSPQRTKFLRSIWGSNPCQRVFCVIAVLFFLQLFNLTFFVFNHFKVFRLLDLLTAPPVQLSAVVVICWPFRRHHVAAVVVVQRMPRRFALSNCPPLVVGTSLFNQQLWKQGSNRISRGGEFRQLLLLACRQGKSAQDLMLLLGRGRLQQHLGEHLDGDQLLLLLLLQLQCPLQLQRLLLVKLRLLCGCHLLLELLWPQVCFIIVVVLDNHGPLLPFLRICGHRRICEWICLRCWLLLRLPSPLSLFAVVVPLALQCCANSATAGACNWRCCCCRGCFERWRSPPAAVIVQVVQHACGRRSASVGSPGI
jgi:hypothetical protein